MNIVVNHTLCERSSGVSDSFFQQVRLYELNKALVTLERFSSLTLTILEIGVGTVWQARAWLMLGFDVAAIDIPNSNHSTARVWPISDCEGQSIFFPDASFDIVYSAIVLEHVTSPGALNHEIKRGMRKDGIAVHFVPTTARCIWSLLGF